MRKAPSKKVQTAKILQKKIDLLALNNVRTLINSSQKKTFFVMQTFVAKNKAKVLKKPLKRP